MVGEDGSLRLGDVAARLPVLVVACSRCPRAGRLSTAGLVQRHGAKLRMPDLRPVLAADCPRMVTGAFGAPCGVHFPGLVGLRW